MKIKNKDEFSMCKCRDVPPHWTKNMVVLYGKTVTLISKGGDMLTVEYDGMSYRIKKEDLA